MAYNITAWTTKTLECLRIPFDALKCEGFNAIVVSVSPDGIEILMDTSESGVIKGTIKYESPKMLEISHLSLANAYSGWYYTEYLIPALQKSTGKLEALIIWESGDAIKKLIVDDGVISDKSVNF
jgi:hypothetical protein